MRRQPPIERITLAAIDCFREFGIENTSMDDIASKANVGRPNLYRYINNRDDLIKLVVMHRAKSLSNEFEAHPGNWNEAMADLFIQYVNNAIHDEIFMIIVEQAAPVASRLLIDDPLINSSMNELLIPIIAEGRKSGTMRKDISDEEIVHWIHYQVWCLTRDPRMVESINIEMLARHFVVGALITQQSTATNIKARHKNESFFTNA